MNAPDIPYRPLLTDAAPDRMRRDPGMVQFVRDMNAQGKVVAAICHAGWLLTTADIVRGRTVTGFFSLHVDLRNAGAEVVDRDGGGAVFRVRLKEAINGEEPAGTARNRGLQTRGGH